MTQPTPKDQVNNYRVVLEEQIGLLIQSRDRLESAVDLFDAGIIDAATAKLIAAQMITRIQASAQAILDFDSPEFTK